MSSLIGQVSINKNKNQIQLVFNQHLASLGASRDEIKRINDSINDLVNKANIKQEDMSDKISLLKKLEMKFHQLVEMRKVFEFFDSKTLLKKEKEIKDIINLQNHDKRTLRAQKLQEAQAAMTLQKIEKKKSLKVSKNIRNVERSKKPELKIQKDDKVKTPPEVEEMRKYLGQMDEDFEAAMFKSQP